MYVYVNVSMYVLMYPPDKKLLYTFASGKLWSALFVSGIGYLLVVTSPYFRPKGIFVVCPPVSLSVRLSVRKLLFCRTLNRYIFELESPNLHQTCILEYSRLVLKMDVIDH